MSHDVTSAGGDHAPEFDVLVVGDDGPALLLALECAKFGFRVAVADHPRPLPLPAEFVHSSSHVTELCDELGVGYVIERREIFESEVVGIPTNAFAPQVRTRVGWATTWRIYLDRLMPLLRIGNEPDFGTLVRKRLGRSATEALVRPEMKILFGLDAVNAPIDEVAPGLSQAVSRVGSLTGGALELIVENPGWRERVTIVGGTIALITRLTERLSYFAVTRLANENLHTVRAQFVVDDASCTPEHPSWAKQIQRARIRAHDLRRALLRDPEKPPIGPVDLEQ